MRTAFVETGIGEMPILRCLLAETSLQQLRGLSPFHAVPEHGMLFDFGQPRVQQMTMEQTQMPLAMAFIRPNGTIAHVVPHAPARSGRYGWHEPVRWVLESTPEIFLRAGLGHTARRVQIWLPTTTETPA